MGKRNQVAVTTWRPLSRQEANRLQECEARIRKALDDMRDAWKEFGSAMGEVNEAELWRGKADSFGAYCEVEWKIPRATCYEWMAAAGVVVSFKDNPVVIDGECKVIDPPNRIQHAKLLARLPAIMRPQALQNAKAKAECEGREVTTYDIRREVALILHEPEPTSNDYQRSKREQQAFRNQMLSLWEKLDAQNKCEVLVILQMRWKKESSRQGD